MNQCPICLIEEKVIIEQIPKKNVYKVECPKCGSFDIGSPTYDHFIKSQDYNLEWRAKASYWIRNRQKKSERVEFPTDNSVIESISLPTFREQIDKYIFFIGENQSNPEKRVRIIKEYLCPIIGSISVSGVNQVKDHLLEKRIISAPVADEYRLTLDGWDRYEEIKNKGVISRRAFMAMKFGDKVLTAVYNDNFKKAVKQTGFDLFKLDDNPKAGLIDDRMRVEIRNSRFLLSDLSHCNAGAYWEAGFAEGLGKPVIYLCRNDVFENPEKKPHFDTNHHLTIVWDPSKINEAEQLLKDTIRATLPLEAKMTDD